MYYYRRLRDLREDHDLSQSDIAEVLSMKQQQYSNYESGRREIPVHHLITLANYYNVTIDYLVGRTDNLK